MNARHVTGDLGIEQHDRFPVFSLKETRNFTRRYARPQHDAASVHVRDGAARQDMELQSPITAGEVYKKLVDKFGAASFVVQLGNQLFRLEENNSEQWNDISHAHGCTVMVCREKVLPNQQLAALHNTGFANIFIDEDKEPEKNDNYHVVFINSDGFNAVRILSENAKNRIDEGKWRRGTMASLPGATLWADTGNTNQEDWIALLEKLHGPVRLMVCASMGNRFISQINQDCFQKLNRIFWLPAAGVVDLVQCGDKEHISYGIDRDVSNWLSGIPCRLWWYGETGKMFEDIKSYHGVPLYRMMNCTRPLTHKNLVANSYRQEYLLSVAKAIASTLDIEMQLRAIKIFSGKYSGSYESLLQKRLQQWCLELSKIKESTVQENRPYLENAVNHYRKCWPVTPHVQVNLGLVHRLG